MSTLTALLLCLLITLPAYSQTRVVKGKITTFNHYPVQNVEVASKKAKSVVLTDSLGQFELLCNEKDMIMIKAKGFNSLDKRVTSKDDFVTANLIYKDSKKNREIVTGLGYIKPDQLSYALAHLSAENNDFCNYSDIFSLLRANFPGLQEYGGAGGAGRGVYVRGNKSLSPSAKNEAVYEVDGMIVSDISFVNPCDIASIEIMKSGGTAIYGTQAVNGVIIIKTKGHMITHD